VSPVIDLVYTTGLVRVNTDILLQDSYPTGSGYTNAEEPDENTSEGAQQGHYTDTGEAIGDVQGYEDDSSYVCENPWTPFTSGQGFKLASWFIESKVEKSRIND